MPQPSDGDRAGGDRGHAPSTCDAPAAGRVARLPIMNTRSFGPSFSGLRSSFLLAEVVLLVTFIASSAMADADSEYGVALQFYKQQRWEQSAKLWADFIPRYPQSPRLPLAKLYYGQALIQTGKYAEARETFRDYVARYPAEADIPLARYRIAECSVFLNDLDAARAELKAFLSQHANHDLAEWGWQYQGEVLAKQGKFAEAADSFRTVLTKYQSGKLTEDAKFGLARAEEQLKHVPEAMALYRELAAAPNGRFAAESLFCLGTRFFDDRQYPQALEQFTAIEKRFPEHSLVPTARLHSGYVHFATRQYDAAAAEFEKVTQPPGLALTAQYWLGLCKKELGDFAAAIQILSRLDPQAKALRPLGQEVAFHWGDSELRQEHFDKARELFLEATRRDPAGELADDALYLASDAAVRAGRFDDAERMHAEFRRTYAQSGLALLEELVYGRAIFGQGNALEATDPAGAKARWASAAQVFERVARESTVPRTSILARIQLARVQARGKNFEAVVATLLPLKEELVSDQVPREYTEALVLLSNSLIELKRSEEAVTVLKVYQDSSPEKKNPVALSTLAVASAQLGKWDDARRAVASLAEAEPAGENLAYAAATVGDLAFRAEEWPAAAEMFQREVGLGETYPKYWRALSDLGHTYINMEKWSDAAAAMSGVLQSKGQDAALISHITYLYGYALQKVGETGDAAVRTEKTAAAVKVFEEGYDRFRLPAEAKTPSETALRVSYNAYQCAKGAARCYARLEKSADADAWWEKAYNELTHQTDPKYRDLDVVLSEWAAMNNNAGNDARADELFQRLLKDFPGSQQAVVARLSVAQGMANAGETQQAIQAFEAILAQPKLPDEVRRTALLWLIDVAAETSDWSTSLANALAFEKAFPASEHRFYAKFRKAEALLQLAVRSPGGASIEAGRGSEQVDEAIKLLIELKQSKDVALKDSGSTIGQEEWYPQVWLLLTEAYFRIRNHTAVAANVEELRSQDPMSKFLYQMDEILGRSLNAQAKFDEARAAFTRVIESPDGKRTETAAKAQFYLAETFLLQKKYAEALEEYYKVYVSYAYPEWQAMALYQAIRCDLELKRPEGAAKTLETLKTGFPDSEYTKKAEVEVKAILDKTQPEKPA